jgi:parvulin-like peptidyl-prolyl isomerase
MQRGVSTIVGAAAVGLAVWVVARSFQPPHPIGHDPHEHAFDGGPEDGGELLYAYGRDAGSGDDAGGLFVSDLSELSFPPAREDGGVFSDGTPVPPLPLTAPRQVRFGVVLVAYSGAQPSAAGGHVPSRSRSDAKALAAKLSATAAADFHAAVQQGDPGSSDDVGKVRTGILEPAPEYVLFTLPVEGVGGPVDTPRGYWIVKRLE